MPGLKPVTDPDLLALLEGGNAAPSPGGPAPAETAAPGGVPGYIHVGGTPKPTEQWRDATPEEVAASGRNPNFKWQINSAGEFKAAEKGTAAPDIKARQQAVDLLRAAGVDLEKGTDPIAPLIRESTSGRMEHKGAQLYEDVTGVLGGVGIGPGSQTTTGMENIGKLKTMVSALVLTLTEGGLGNQISDADRQFFEKLVGDLGNPEVSWNERLAAWEQAKVRMGNILGVKYEAKPTGAGAQPATAAGTAAWFPGRWRGSWQCAAAATRAWRTIAR